MEGIIIKSISNDWTVNSVNINYICKARGKFKNNDISPIVGDIVIFDEQKKLITDIKPRKNVLKRPPIANVDQALIITSAKDPNFNSNLLDKLLTIISYNNITPIICWTKLDLLNDIEKKQLEKTIEYYKNIGYKTINNQNINEFKKIFKNKVTVLTGQSGAGKSTLINLLDKQLNLKTGETSKALGRGKHTTRHVELYNIYDGYIVDTPGFSSVDLNDLSPESIRDNMIEMYDNLQYCKYRDCMHQHEDGCAVIKKIKNFEILESRYENYKKFINRS